jgi:hypothetical protein
MKKSILVLFSLTIILGSTNIASAHSGCCSHHGGVCGCGCCDGSGLSATCLPYYPECKQTSIIQKPVIIAPVITSQTSQPIKTVSKSVTTASAVTSFVGKPKTYKQLYSCKIVGNYSSMIYFPKGSAYIKKMTLSKKECFASASDAIAKGFRKVK